MFQQSFLSFWIWWNDPTRRFPFTFQPDFRDLLAHGKQPPLITILEKHTVEGNVNP